MERVRRFGSVAAWAVLLATPLLWGAHLTLLYLVASVELTLREEAGYATRIVSAVATVVTLAAIAALGWAMHARRLPQKRRLHADLDALWHRAGACLAVLSFLGVAWQGLVALTVPGATAYHDALHGGTVPPQQVHREYATDAGAGARDGVSAP